MIGFCLLPKYKGEGGGGCSIFPMIKAGPNCFDNIKDLAVAGCVRAVLEADRLVVAGGSDSVETEHWLHYVERPSEGLSSSSSKGPNSANV